MVACACVLSYTGAETRMHLDLRAQCGPEKRLESPSQKENKQTNKPSKAKQRQTHWSFQGLLQWTMTATKWFKIHSDVLAPVDHFAPPWVIKRFSLSLRDSNISRLSDCPKDATIFFLNLFMWPHFSSSQASSLIFYLNGSKTCTFKS